MCFTVATKITLGMTLILFLGLLPMLVVYFGLTTVEQTLRTMTQVQEPAKTAAHELEINVVEIGLKVLKYLDTGDPLYRQQVEEDANDFARFAAEYDHLADTAEEKALSRKLDQLYREYRALGDTLMNHKEQQESLLTAVAQNFERMDEIIDDKIQTGIAPNRPDGARKATLSMDVETDIAEVGAWLGHYLRTLKEPYRARILDNIKDFEEEFVQFTRLALSEQERRWAHELDTLFRETQTHIRDILVLHDSLQESLGRFRTLRVQLDNVLDEEIQSLSIRDLRLGEDAAARAHTRVNRMVALLLPTFLVCGIGAAVLVVRVIRRPLQELQLGTSAVAEGKLGFRLTRAGRDEFAEVAKRFNQMVARLEETTVSKERLEHSEAQLQKTNADLLREVAERRQAEQTLRQSEESFRALIENASDIIAILDRDDTIRYFSPSIHQVLGYTPEAVVGRKCSEIIHPDDVSHVLQIFASICQNPGATSSPLEYRCGHADGTWRVLEGLARNLLHEPAVAGIVVNARDITERKRAQEVLQETNRRLEETLATLQTAQQQLLQQERLAAVGQLAAGIAHDFNNILTSILGFAELLQLERNLPEPVRKDLQIILSQGERAVVLIRQILDFSRQSIVPAQPVDLVPVLQETARLLQRTLPESVHLGLEIAPGDHVIDADEGQLQQVLTNLAFNARDAMPPQGGELHFRLSSLTLQPGESTPLSYGMPAGDWVVLEAADTGRGMPPEVVEHVFEPFFTTKEVGQGTGLGLAQVYGIVKQHGGYIGVQSRVGHGTTFTLYFPAGASEQGKGEEQGGKIPQGRGETLLLVEDEEAVRETVRAMLERIHYRVLVAANGQEALSVYEQHEEQIRGVITDIVMPKMGGEELCRTLSERNPDLKFVVFSGYPLEEEAKTFVIGGRAEWLQKPPRLQQLARVVYRVLREEVLL